MPIDLVLVSLPPPLLARLERWESQQPVPPPRASVLLGGLELWLGMEESAHELASETPPQPVKCRFCGRDADATWDAHRCDTGGHVCDECLGSRTVSCIDCGQPADPRGLRCDRCHQADEESDA